MTMISAPRTPDFPDHPQDGFQIIEELPDGRKLIWTYNAELNQWNSQFINPQDAATEGWVLEQGYVQGPVRTADVLTTDPPTVVVDAEGTQSILATQEEVNNFVANAADTAVKAASRTGDVLDFLQNSIGKGTWIHTFAGVGVPQTSEFWVENNVAEFADITKIYVNDKGIAASGSNDPGTLADTRVGDYLIIQERGTNDFGQYVVDSVAIEVKEEQTIREFGLVLYEGRAKGSSQVNSSRCQITTSRPMYVVVQDDEPKVSTRGVLWYREGDDILSISNYATGQVGVDGPQWTEINGGGGGVNPDDYLKKSGGTMTGQLEVSRPGEDQAGRYIFSIKAEGLEDGRQVAFRVTADGAVKAGHDTSHPFMAKSANDVVTKKYLDNQIAAIPEPEAGGSFISKYDGNRFVRNGNMQTDLNSGDVLFMTAEYKQTENPDEIAYISLPKGEFDWHAFTNSGNIKVKAGSSTAGYYYAFAYMHQASDQVLVSVFPLKTYPDKKLEADSGAPCYFHGLFFGSEPAARKRARNEDGTFRADDPSTPGVNEAWE